MGERTGPRGPAEPPIRGFLRTPERYFRSVHVERDFADPHAVDDYQVTPSLAVAFSRVLDGCRPESGHRAWRITGDYGSGKSAFALVLAHLLRDPENPRLASIRRDIDVPGPGDRPQRMLPILVTGAREGIVRSVGRAVERAIGEILGGLTRRSAPKGLAALEASAASAAREEDGAALVNVLRELTAFACANGRTGVLLVIDELGKLLEYAALNPDCQDVYVLQQLAEAAVRSGGEPLMVVGILHQGFQAYAERLASAGRAEWAKVAERFEEVVFDQPLVHTARLVTGALGVRTASLPSAVRDSGILVAAQTDATGWFGSGEPQDPLALFPLHPTVLPPLVAFMTRYGQNERSLFSFLFSSEPFALPAFLERPANPGNWFRIADFYDYVRAAFGQRLGGSSHRTQWARIAGIVDAADVTDAVELRVLKTVALLNALDADHLLPTDAILRAAVEAGRGRGERGGERVQEALRKLRSRGILFDRGAAGGFCLWPNTSINLDVALAAAERDLGPTERVGPHLAPYLDHDPLVARRHYIESGTLRHFEVRYCGAADLAAALEAPSDADGVIAVALCDTNQERLAAEGFAASDPRADRSTAIVGVPVPLGGLAPELHDVRRWSWVEQNTPGLANDQFAAAEVSRQLAVARRRLEERLRAAIGLRGSSIAPTTWFHRHQVMDIPPRKGLVAALSAVCDRVYRKAPRVRNELINRRNPSSAAVSARTRLIERMLSQADRSELGMDPSKAPPERSMYLSVLAAGRIHREVGGTLGIHFPGRAPGSDPLRLSPVLQILLRMLEADEGGRVPVASLWARIEKPPFGVRPGLVPLLVAVLLVGHRHEIAVYENGTFLRSVGPAEFLRLTKIPTAFEFQLCRIRGVRADVFDRIVQVFVQDLPGGRRADLLDAVRPLLTFMAGLPDYTRRSAPVSTCARRVREALLNATDPAELLFSALPRALDFQPFLPAAPPDGPTVRRFVSALRDSLDELRNAYPDLLERLRGRVGFLLCDGGALDLEGVARRARRVAAAVSETRGRTFALRIADIAPGHDAWAEALASFVASKHPARWTTADEVRWSTEIDALASSFHRYEALAMDPFRSPTGGAEEGVAVRVGVTDGGAGERARVVRFRAEDEPQVSEMADKIGGALPDRADLRLAVLARLLQRELAAQDASTGVQEGAGASAGSAGTAPLSQPE